MYYFWGIGTFYLLIPAILLAMYADYRVKHNFKKYARIKNSRNLTGAEAARRVLNYNGLHDVEIRPVGGYLTDNYNPSTRVLSLSQNVYYGATVSAIGVACHEVGHAIQHAQGYLPLKLRNAFVPLTNLVSGLIWPMMLVGLLLLTFGSRSTYALGSLGGMMFDFAILAFLVIVLFHLITLPVEFNASRRALANMKEYEIVSKSDIRGAGKVLRAAALTYVAALAMAVGNLLRMIAIRNRSE